MRRGVVEAGLVVAVVLLVAALLRQRAETAAIVASAEQIREEHDKVKTKLLHLSHFHRAQAAASAGPFLQGFDAVGDAAVRLQRPRDGLYYSVQATCAACARNFPFLTKLNDASTRDFGVVLLSFEDSLPVLRDYVKTHELAMPVLHGPTGAVADFFPKYGTPFAIVVLDGCVVSTSAGVFTSSEERRFEAAARRARPEEYVPPERMRPLDDC